MYNIADDKDFDTIWEYDMQNAMWYERIGMIPATFTRRDNYTLGLRRAVAATEVMRSETQFPNERLLASSAGGLPPPFPENEPGSASRNRTVILRLVPRILE